MATSLVLDFEVEELVVLLSEEVELLDFSSDANEPTDDVSDHNDDDGVCPRWDVAADSLSSGSVNEPEKDTSLILEDEELVVSLDDDDDKDEEEAVLERPLVLKDSSSLYLRSSTWSCASLVVRIDRLYGFSSKPNEVPAPSTRSTGRACSTFLSSSISSGPKLVSVLVLSELVTPSK